MGETAKQVITYSAHGLEVGRSLVLEVVGVGDLSWSPDSLVGRVINQRSRPLALISWVSDHWGLPLAASRALLTLGVGDGWGNPVTVFFVIPVLWFDSLRVGNGSWLVIQPVSWLGGLGVDNLEGSIFIPILGLLSFWVRDLLFVNPVGRLGVLLVINFLWRVNWRSKVLKKGAVLEGFSVNADLEGLIWVDDESIQAGELGNLNRWRGLEVLLLIFAGLGVLVLEDEMNLEIELGTMFQEVWFNGNKYLVGSSTSVGTKHNDVGGGIGEFLRMKLLVLL